MVESAETRNIHDYSYTENRLRHGRNRGGWYVKWAPPGLGYYDTANMARRMSPKAEFVMHSFGLGDYICPPTGVMAMYNNVPCEKKSASVRALRTQFG